MELTKFQLFDLLNRPGPLWLVGVDLIACKSERCKLEPGELARCQFASGQSGGR
jgi:hypothetical protein